jgi:hypothetical protein
MTAPTPAPPSQRHDRSGRHGRPDGASGTSGGGRSVANGGSGQRRRRRAAQRVAGLPRKTWRRLVGGSAVFLLATGLLSALAWTVHGAQPPQWAVGPHAMELGEHYEGDPLPAQHPLRQATPTTATTATTATNATNATNAKAATGAALPALANAGLVLRRWCAWADPGRNPYRGTPEQALKAARLPPEVVASLTQAIADGQHSDRLTITRQSIRAERDGRQWSARALAMTYGRTLCLGTRVNFQPGHSEPASLFEAVDHQGRHHAVMVPDVCGNVSVLSAEEQLAAAAPGERIAKGDTQVQSDEADLGLEGPGLGTRPGTSTPGQAVTGGPSQLPSSSQAVHSVPNIGSAWLVALAGLAAAAALAFKRARRVAPRRA